MAGRESPSLLAYEARAIGRRFGGGDDHPQTLRVLT